MMNANTFDGTSVAVITQLAQNIDAANGKHQIGC